MPNKNGPKKKKDLTTDIGVENAGNARLGQATSCLPPPIVTLKQVQGDRYLRRIAVA